MAGRAVTGLAKAPLESTPEMVGPTSGEMVRPTTRLKGPASRATQRAGIRQGPESGDWERGVVGGQPTSAPKWLASHLEPARSWCAKSCCAAPGRWSPTHRQGGPMSVAKRA